MCGTCNEEGSFLSECDKCFAEICEDCERFIVGGKFCFECAPKIQAEMEEE